MRKRMKTRKVRVGAIAIGGDAPVSIQSMTNIPLEDVDGTIRQINRLAEEGADMVRVAIMSEESAGLIAKITPYVPIPLSADIHFNYRIALAAIRAGVNKVRINPGNIGGEERVREVIRAAKDNGVPIRIGVNSGSIDRKKYPHPTPENIVDSALQHITILEDNDFHDIVVSLKSSNIFDTIESYRLFAGKKDYPLHVGLTEAGYGVTCVVNSTIAIGSLLMDGIGDTIRVSMTGDPVDEVIVGKKILEAVAERTPRIRIISCPTCGRTDTEIDILALAKEVDKTLHEQFFSILEERKKTITIAVMGCEVNGPGEAKEADAGLAGARSGSLLLFTRGEKLGRVRAEDAVSALTDEIRKILLPVD